MNNIHYIALAQSIMFSFRYKLIYWQQTFQQLWFKCLKIQYRSAVQIFNFMKETNIWVFQFMQFDCFIYNKYMAVANFAACL